MTTATESTQAAELTIEDLYAIAEAEVSGLAISTDDESISPVDEPEAETVEAEDINEVKEDEPEQAEEAVDEFDFDIETDVEEDTPGGLDLSAKVPVTGHGEVSIEELRNGYMMQADYTRSKQALVAEKQAWVTQNEAAAKIMDSLQNDPVGMAAYLAVETGLLNESDLDGKNIDALRDVVKVPKAEEVEAEIQRRVDEAVKADPRIVEAQASAVRAAIDSEFAAIESSIGQPLSEKAKIEVIRYANEHDLNDLGVAFDALSAGAARTRAKREALKATATERPKVRGGDTAGKPRRANTVEEALEFAMEAHDEG